MPVIELTLDATQLILGSICYLLTIVKILIIVSFNFKVLMLTPHSSWNKSLEVTKSKSVLGLKRDLCSAPI
jgi:hypothetical protein